MSDPETGNEFALNAEGYDGGPTAPAPGDNQPTWTVDHDVTGRPMLRWPGAMDALEQGDLPFALPDAWDALVAAVRDAQHLPAALDAITEFVDAERQVYLLGKHAITTETPDPIAAERIAIRLRYVNAHKALVALAETRPQ
jgi:hypothetical protein